MRSTVLVYRDYGVGDLTNLMRGLKAYFKPYAITVGCTDAASILKENALNEDVFCFVMPGGAATPYLEKLKVQGNQKIREYIKQGGHYLGICAGAYYACSRVEFETDIKPLSIIREHELLDLVDVSAVGTLHKELDIKPYMKNEASAATVKLEWMEDHELHYAHYHGGPKFVSDNQRFEVLARYADLKSAPAAIIAQTFGKGRVVLSGVHFEDRGQDLEKALHAFRLDLKDASRIADVLRKNELSRKMLFNKVMSSFLK